MIPRKSHYFFLSVVTIIVFIVFTWRIVNYADRQMRETLQQQARLTIQSLDIQDIRRLTFSDADKSSAAFQRLEKQMRQANATIGCRMIYTLARRGDQLVFGPENLAETDRYASPPGTVYQQAPRELHDVFNRRQEKFIGPYKDEHGSFVSMFAPVIDPATGELLMVLGIDIETSTWKWRIFNRAALPTSLVLLVLLFLFILTWLIRSNRALRRQKATIRYGEDRYSNFITNASEGIFRIDLEPPVRLDEPYDKLVEQIARRAVVGEVNEALAKMYGLTPEQMVGRPVTEFAPNCGEQMADLTKNEGYRIAERIETEVAADGSSIHIVESYHGVVENGKLLRVWGVQRNVTDRHQTEITLRESEEKYRLIADNMADTISLMDLNFRFTYVSPSIFRLRGLTVEEALGQSIDEIMPPHALTLAIQTLQEEMALEAGGTADPNRTRTLELEEYRKDGSIVWLSNRMSFLRDENGKPTAVLIVSSDITERKRAEEQLREFNKRLNDIIEFLPDATVVIDRDKRVIAWNKAIEEMTGIAKNDILGKGDYEYSLPFYGERRPVLMDLAMAKESDHDRELYDNVTTAGTILYGEVYAPKLFGGKGAYVFATASALRNESGEIVGAIESIRDITGRKNSEDALRSAHDQLLSLLNSLDEIIYVADMDTYEILFVNKVAQQAFNGPIIGKLCYREFQDFDKPCTFCTNEIIKKLNGQPYRWEHHNKHLDRHYVLIDRVIKWPDGRNVRFELATDVTDLRSAEKEREKLEAQLQQAMKMEAVGRLAGGVAHDFNNLLTGITGYTELLLSTLNDNDPIVGTLLEIKKAGDRAAALTTQLLAFSRKQIINPKIVDLNELVNDSAKMLKRLIGEDVELRFIKGQNLGRVKVDSHQIEQVLVNLAVNARDAMENGGELTVETANVSVDGEYAQQHVDAKIGEYVMLSVSDNGCGMPPEVLAHLFEPFFTTKEKGKGTGLGLSMIYGIVRQNEGFITVYSEVDTGTVIKVYLPRVQGEVDTARPKMTDTLPLGNESILLVEDEETVRKLAKRILERHGYRVTTVENGEQALFVAQQSNTPFDLLLTDVIMPGMNGRQLFEHLRAVQPAIRVLFMSGYTENTIAHHGVLEEGMNFIQKPFSVESLVRKVQEVVGGD
ncbi:MAG TPA: PAS domain S-box protein [bacterium]|nr:PAS domain S-box protein [bacterium]